eukprot:INCI17620.4.p1 GENE.INCI17620.4~~INCI17620.4.p1  ORF type:complete len:2019 (-),score=369.16 INCI17620.4:459-6515(-)
MHHAEENQNSPSATPKQQAKRDAAKKLVQRHKSIAPDEIASKMLNTLTALQADPFAFDDSGSDSDSSDADRDDVDETDADESIADTDNNYGNVQNGNDHAASIVSGRGDEDVDEDEEVWQIPHDSFDPSLEFAGTFSKPNEANDELAAEFRDPKHLAHLRAAFKELETDENGRVSLAQLADILESNFGIVLVNSDLLASLARNGHVCNPAVADLQGYNDSSQSKTVNLAGFKVSLGEFSRLVAEARMGFLRQRKTLEESLLAETIELAKTVKFESDLQTIMEKQEFSSDDDGSPSATSGAAQLDNQNGPRNKSTRRASLRQSLSEKSAKRAVIGRSIRAKIFAISTLALPDLSDGLHDLPAVLSAMDAADSASSIEEKKAIAKAEAQRRISTMRSQLVEAMHSAVDATVQSINDSSPIDNGDDGDGDDADDFSDLEPVSMSNLFVDPHAMVAEVMAAITPAASPAGKHASDASAKRAAAFSLAGPGQQSIGEKNEETLNMDPLAPIRPDGTNSAQPWSPPDTDETREAMAAARALFDDAGPDVPDPTVENSRPAAARSDVGKLSVAIPNEKQNDGELLHVEPLEQALEELASPRSDTVDKWHDPPRRHTRGNTWVNSHPHTKDLVTEISDVVAVSLGIEDESGQETSAVVSSRRPSRQKKMKKRASTSRRKGHDKAAAAAEVAALEQALVERFRKLLALSAERRHHAATSGGGATSPASASVAAEEARVRADIDTRVAELARLGARALLEDGEISLADLPSSEVMLEEELRRTLRTVAMQQEEDAQRKAQIRHSPLDATSTLQAQRLPTPQAEPAVLAVAETFPELCAENTITTTGTPPPVSEALRTGAASLAGATSRRLTFHGNLLSPVDVQQHEADRSRALAAKTNEAQPGVTAVPRLRSLPKIPHVEAIAQRERIPLVAPGATPRRPQHDAQQRALPPPPPGNLGGLVYPAKPVQDPTKIFASRLVIKPAPPPAGLLTPVSQQKQEDHVYNSQPHVAPHLRNVVRLPTPESTRTTTNASPHLKSSSSTTVTPPAVPEAPVVALPPPPGMLGAGPGSAAEGLEHLRRASCNGGPGPELAGLAAAHVAAIRGGHNPSLRPPPSQQVTMSPSAWPALIQDDEMPLSVPSLPQGAHAPPMVPVNSTGLPAAHALGSADALAAQGSDTVNGAKSSNLPNIVQVRDVDPSVVASTSSVVSAAAAAVVAAASGENSFRSQENGPVDPSFDRPDGSTRAPIPKKKKPLLSQAIARPLELLRELLRLGRRLPDPPGALYNRDFQEQLNTLCLGVFPFITQRCQEASTAALQGRGSTHRLQDWVPAAIDADMLSCFGVVASVVAEVASVAANPAVIGAGAGAVARLQDAAIGVLSARLEGLKALKQREGGARHAEAMRCLGADLEALLRAPALEARALAVVKGLSATGEDSDSDSDSKGAIFPAPQHGSEFVERTLFEPLEFLAAKFVPAAAAADVSFNQEALVATTVAKKLVARVTNLPSLDDDGRAKVLQLLHYTLQRIEAARRRQDLREAAAAAARAEAEAEADFVYIEDEEQLLDSLWAVFGSCSMHCDPLTPESVGPSDFGRMVRLCFGVQPIEYHHTTSPAKQARQRRKRHQEEAAAQRVLELPIASRPPFPTHLPEVDAATLHQHLQQGRGCIRPDILAHYVVLKVLQRPGRRASANALSFCEFIHALNVLLYRVCTGKGSDDVGDDVVAFYDDEFVKLVVHRDFGARFRRYILPTMGPKCRRTPPIAALVQHSDLQRLRVKYERALDILFQSYDQARSMPTPAAPSSDSANLSLLLASFGESQAKAQNALAAIADVPSEGDLTAHEVGQAQHPGGRAQQSDSEHALGSESTLPNTQLAVAQGWSPFTRHKASRRQSGFQRVHIRGMLKWPDFRAFCMDFHVHTTTSTVDPPFAFLSALSQRSRVEEPLQISREELWHCFLALAWLQQRKTRHLTVGETLELLLARAVKACEESWREGHHRHLYTKDENASVAMAATDHRIRRIEPFVRELRKVFSKQ